MDLTETKRKAILINKGELADALEAYLKEYQADPTGWDPLESEDPKAYGVEVAQTLWDIIEGKR